MTTASTRIDEPAGVSFGPENLPQTLYACDGGRDLIRLANVGGLAWSGLAIRDDPDGEPRPVVIRLTFAGPAAWDLSVKVGSAGGCVHGTATAPLHSSFPFMASFPVDFGVPGSPIHGSTATFTVSE